MVYLATDKQTYADLSITETASNEQFLFSLFSKTETKEGKALMLNWLMYPLSDLEEIRKRQEAIVWDALPELLLNEEELDFINRLRRPVIWGGGYRLYRFAGGQEGFDRRFGND